MNNQKITKEQRKEQLVNIALEMFGTVGYTKTKVSDIVAKANVSQGTFYWYFKSKLELASYILERGNEQILQRIAMGYRDEKVPVSSSVQSSTQLFESLFRFAEENRFLMMLLFKGVHTEPELQQRVLATKKNMEHAFAHNIEQAQNFHMIASNKSPAIQAIFIMSLMEGVLIRWLERDEALQHITLNELVESTVHFEFFGIFGV